MMTRKFIKCKILINPKNGNYLSWVGAETQDFKEARLYGMEEMNLPGTSFPKMVWGYVTATVDYYEEKAK